MNMLWAWPMMVSQGSRPANVLNLENEMSNATAKKGRERGTLCKSSSNRETCDPPGKRPSPERRFSLCCSNELVGINYVATADLEAMEHGEAVERMLEPSGSEFELSRPITNK